MSALALAAALVISGAPAKSPARTKVATIAEAWKALPESGSACGSDLGFDYGVEGGMRNFFCRALTIFSWKAFVSLAPASPFLSGPHQGTRLDLNAKTQFGHYNPEFVRWASTALVPALSDPSLRAQTQATYDRQVRVLARTYYKVWRTLSSRPDWMAKERTAYAAAMAKGEGDWSGSVVDLYNDVLGTAEQSWGGFDPNLVRSATMWWLRRTLDETATQWALGLERLLTTYDSEWLRSERVTTPTKPPARQAVPEYAE